MGELLFGPDSMMWKINRESILLLGGRGALLMQLAHPLVAAGVDSHSDFRDDGFARLRRTLDPMLSIVFGDVANARRVAAGIDSVHAKVRGTTEEGTAYSALDPTLKLWVHSTLVDSSMRAYETFVARLGDEERAQYYEETKVVAELFRIPPGLTPPTLGAMRGWMSDMISTGEVHVTPLAKDLAADILNPLPLLPHRLARAVDFITPALLPRSIREAYGLRLSRPSAVLFALGRGTTRALVPRLPSPLRMWPAARAAERSLA